MHPLLCSSTAIVAALAFAHSPRIYAGTARFEFTGGSLAATLKNIPPGVTVEPLILGAKFLAPPGTPGNLFDQGGGADSLRITGADGTTSGTVASFSTGTTLSFTVHIPPNVTMSLQSLTLRYRGTSVVGRSNARVFSTIRGHLDASNDTVGILGRDAEGSDADFVLDAINLVTPRSSGGGGNIQNGDFTNLSGASVTFEIPWMDGNESSTSWIDLDDLALNFVEKVPPVVSSLKITDFQILDNHSARVSFTGDNGTPFSLMASEDLTGPVYRKRWISLLSGDFDGTGKVFTDSAAIPFSRRFYIATASKAPKARIFPVGDSITEGGTGIVYRGGLFDKLNAGGYRFEYVGSKISSHDGNILRYEGYSGYNATEIANFLQVTAASNPADIVIIHAGHNFNKNELVLTPFEEAAILDQGEAAIRSMAASCRLANPRVILLVAKVIHAGKLPKYSYIPALNIRYNEVAFSLDSALSPVIVVDQAEGFVWQTDTITTDMVHPNAAGAEKMVAKFFDALVPLLE